MGIISRHTELKNPHNILQIKRNLNRK